MAKVTKYEKGVTVAETELDPTWLKGALEHEFVKRVPNGIQFVHPCHAPAPADSPETATAAAGS